MAKTNSQTVRDHRLRLRARDCGRYSYGYRTAEHRLLPSRPRMTCVCVAELPPEDQALLDAFERSAVEDFAGEWR